MNEQRLRVLLRFTPCTPKLPVGGQDISDRFVLPLVHADYYCCLLRARVPCGLGLTCQPNRLELMLEKGALGALPLVEPEDVMQWKEKEF
jgi:hypothetical protein